MIICYKDSQNSLKVAILMVMVNYSDRIQIKSAKGRDAWGRVQEEFKFRAPSRPLPMGSWTGLTPLSNDVYNIHRVSPTREIHPSLGV